MWVHPKTKAELSRYYKPKKESKLKEYPNVNLDNTNEDNCDGLDNQAKGDV